MTDADLYERGIATLLAAWEAYALGARDAVMKRLPGVSAGVFPYEPERRFYNNAVLGRGLAPAERADAVAEVEAAYAAAAVGQFTLWVHESDRAMLADLEGRGYASAESTRAMGMVLNDICITRPEAELRRSDWEEHRRILDLPSDLIARADPSAFQLWVAPLQGEGVATAMAFDHDGDCGIYNVGTVEHARRRGLATALTALHLHEALARGCRTASVQSTVEAESVYVAVGFRDLGRILEYAPPPL